MVAARSAFILGIEEAALNKIIKGKTGVSVEMSKALAEAFDIDADFFSNLQKSYDLANSAAPDPAISRRASLQSQPARPPAFARFVKPLSAGSGASGISSVAISIMSLASSAGSRGRFGGFCGIVPICIGPRLVSRAC